MDEKVSTDTPVQSSVTPDQAHVPIEESALDAEREVHSEDMSQNESEQAAVKTEAPVPFDPSKDPKVQQMVRDAVAKAAEDAARKERARIEKEQERAKMEEIDRIRAEREDVEKERDAFREEIARLQADSAYHDALISSAVQLVSQDAAQFLRMKVEQLRSAQDISWQEAISGAVAEAPFLVKQDPPPAEAPPPQLSTTVPAAPAPRRSTEAPARASAAEPVDVLKMTPQEYARYKVEKHRISH